MFLDLGAGHLQVSLHREVVEVEFHLEGDDHVGVGAHCGFGCAWFAGCGFKLAACANLSKEIVCHEDKCANNLWDEQCKIDIVAHEVMFAYLKGLH